MSRALNLKAEPSAVRAMCAKHDAEITAIESLPAGGTRVVLQSGDQAAVIARAFGAGVIRTDVKRLPLRLQQAARPMEVSSWADRGTTRER